MVPPNVHPSASASPVMYAYSCSPVTSSCAPKNWRPARNMTGSASRNRSLTGSSPSTYVRPKSASHRSKMGPKSRNTMSSAAIARSGGFLRYGCRVFGPARTIRLCQCRSTPNISAARSRTASLASVSRTPGAMMPRGSMAANRSAALACASRSRAERTPSSSTRLFLANGRRLELYRLKQGLHPRPQVGGCPGRDEVAVHHGGLVHPVGARVDHVVADRADAGGPPALEDPGRDRHPARVADEGDRLVRAVERPYQVQHGLRAPQLVRRKSARDDQGVELTLRHLLHGGVHRHRPVALLSVYRVVVESRHGHLDVLLGQPVQRIQQLHVFEVVRGQDENGALRESHVSDHTHADAGDPCAGRPAEPG